MIDVMRLQSNGNPETTSFSSRYDEEVRNSVFGGSEADSDSVCCGNSRAEFNSRIDPARFYEDYNVDALADTDIPVSPPRPFKLPRLLADLYNDRRRDARVQSLEDVVLLFAIPLRKRNGLLNNQWHACVLLPSGRAERRALNHRFDDPINGDKVFCYIHPVDPQPGARLSFVLSNADNEDLDVPPDGCYDLPIEAPGVFSLRDGVMSPGDHIHDIGIVIYFDAKALRSLPILHYFDEVAGVWTTRSFAVTSCCPFPYNAVLPGCRRTQFIIEISGSGFIRPSGSHGDFSLPWPGSYVVDLEGKLVTHQTED